MLIHPALGLRGAPRGARGRCAGRHQHPRVFLHRPRSRSRATRRARLRRRIPRVPAPATRRGDAGAESAALERQVLRGGGSAQRHSTACTGRTGPRATGDPTSRANTLLSGLALLDQRYQALPPLATISAGQVIQPAMTRVRRRSRSHPRSGARPADRAHPGRGRRAAARPADDRIGDPRSRRSSAYAFWHRPSVAEDEEGKEPTLIGPKARVEVVEAVEEPALRLLVRSGTATRQERARHELPGGGRQDADRREPRATLGDVGQAGRDGLGRPSLLRDSRVRSAATHHRAQRGPFRSRLRDRCASGRSSPPRRSSPRRSLRTRADPVRTRDGDGGQDPVEDGRRRSDLDSPPALSVPDVRVIHPWPATRSSSSSTREPRRGASLPRSPSNSSGAVRRSWERCCSIHGSMRRANYPPSPGRRSERPGARPRTGGRLRPYPSRCRQDTTAGPWPGPRAPATVRARSRSSRGGTRSHAFQSTFP